MSRRLILLIALSCPAGLVGVGAAIERTLSMVLLREDLGDLRFRSYPYAGRLCGDLRVHARAGTGTVTIENTGDAPLHDLHITIKAFAHTGRVVVERVATRLGPGERLVYDEDNLGLSETIREDLGMLYVRVHCDEGFALARGWWSYWG